MWVNKRRNLEQSYILKVEDLPKIICWSEAFAESKLNVWYDGQLVSPAAVEATNRAIDGILSERHRCSRLIFLRDIREIPVVRCHEDVFSEYMDVYFRVDLLRPIIALYLLNDTNETDYFVYADLDMVPQNPRLLFNEDTLRELHGAGMLLAKHPRSEAEESVAQCGFLNYENSFQIISKNNRTLMDSLQFVLIDANLIRAREALSSGPLSPLLMVKLVEAVYHSYQGVFKYQAFLKGLGKLYVTKYIKTIIPAAVKKVKGRELIIPMHEKENFIAMEYDKSRDGLRPFNIEAAENIVFVPNKVLSSSNHYLPGEGQDLISIIKSCADNLFNASVVEVGVPRSNIAEYKQLILSKK